MSCPGCSARLAEAYVEASYGRVVLVDQCTKCGGVWFDRWELYFLGPDSLDGLVTGTDSGAHAQTRTMGALSGALAGVPVIEGIATLDPTRFLAINPARTGTGPCPRCRKVLKDFTDPALPKDASIKRCPECSGLWLNRGDVELYAEHRRNKGAGGRALVAPPAPKAEGDLPEPRIETLKNLQKELDTRGIADRVEAYDAAALSDEPLTGREFATDVGFIILQALLRMVFKV